MGRGLFFMPLVLGLVVGLLPASAAPLHEAAKSGDVEETERLIQAGADLEALDLDGETPLTAAALAGQTVAVKLLVARGADIKRQNRGGFTALHAAAYTGHIQIVDFALDRGAVIDQELGDLAMIPFGRCVQRRDLRLVALVVDVDAAIDKKFDK